MTTPIQPSQLRSASEQTMYALYDYRNTESSERELKTATNMLLRTIGEVWHERLTQEYGEENPEKIKEMLRKLIEEMTL